MTSPGKPPFAAGEGPDLIDQVLDRARQQAKPAPLPIVPDLEPVTPIAAQTPGSLFSTGPEPSIEFRHPVRPVDGLAEIRLRTWPGADDELLGHSGYHGNPVRSV